MSSPRATETFERSAPTPSEAFEALYRRAFPRVYGYVATLLRDRGAAEEVTAQAFERAFRKRRSFRASRGSEEAWLFGEGPGGFVLAGEIVEIERLVEAGTATLIGVAAGQDIRIAAGPLSVDVPVADAAAAWSSLGELMEAAHA